MLSLGRVLKFKHLIILGQVVRFTTNCWQYNNRVNRVKKEKKVVAGEDRSAVSNKLFPLLLKFKLSDSFILRSGE